jgi:hypothetical protein
MMILFDAVAILLVIVAVAVVVFPFIFPASFLFNNRVVPPQRPHIIAAVSIPVDHGGDEP